MFSRGNLFALRYWSSQGMMRSFGVARVMSVKAMQILSVCLIQSRRGFVPIGAASADKTALAAPIDRKSTRLNSSHSQISYAVFCLKKKKKKSNSNKNSLHYRP